MGLKAFKTDPKVEKEGIILNYEEEGFRITVARAGGANKRFQKLLEAKMKPFKRAAQTGTLSNERAVGILQEVYSMAVVLKWETLVDGKWKEGIEDLEIQNEAGTKIVPASPENILAVFKSLDELWKDVQEQASSYAAFKQEVLETDAKN